MKQSSPLAKAGLLTGVICLVVLYCIAVYGPSSYSASGSGTVNRDGTITYLVQNRPLLPMLARTAFYGFGIPLLLGIASLLRRESTLAGFGALAYGLAPVFIYTVGTVFTAMLYLAVTFSVVAIQRWRKAASQAKQDQAKGNAQ
jgi:hypothetical protein